jgi:hypothetical protein
MASLLLLLLTVPALPVTPYGPSDAHAWKMSLSAHCNGHHIQEWMPEGNQVDLIDGFTATLNNAQQKRLRILADVRRDCSQQQAGQSCEKIVDLHAIRHIGLLSQFSSYACKTVSCSEPALCEQLKPAR